MPGAFEDEADQLENLMIVVADEDQSRFNSALAVLPVPAVDPRLGFILSTLADDATERSVS